MKQIIVFLVLIINITWGCEKTQKADEIVHFKLDAVKQLHSGPAIFKALVYLPVYADIYHVDQSRLFALTPTLSLRNTSMKDSLFIYKIDYYNTEGHILKSYIENTSMLALAPMETYDLVINNKQYPGGTGANLIVEWGRINGKAELLVQAVMISTSGQQGLSFITEGHTIETHTTTLSTEN